MLQAILVLVLLTHFPAAASDTRPNIVLLLADDLGIGEVGAYGQKVIETPAIDRLADQGTRFAQFYAGAPVCAPSRAVLVTGRSPLRVGIRGNEGVREGRWSRVPLSKQHQTIGELLDQAGYETMFAGKWHLDDPNDLSTWATSRGFEQALQVQWGFTPRSPLPSGAEPFWLNGDERAIGYRWPEWQSQDEFLTEQILGFLKNRDTSRPFFLFASFRAPHAHEREIGNRTLYADRGWSETERIHAAKITLLDRQVDRLVRWLEEAGLTDNTLVIFTSDNGPHGEGGHDPKVFDSNGRYRGIKRDLYEGGVRVPGIFYWPGRVAAGRIETAPASQLDLFPTLAELAGAKAPADLDGWSLLPLLDSGTAATEASRNDWRERFEARTLAWEFHLVGDLKSPPDDAFRQAARSGDWKAVRYGLDNDIELYNLSLDPSERLDLSFLFRGTKEALARAFTAGREEAAYFPFGGAGAERDPVHRAGATADRP